MSSKSQNDYVIQNGSLIGDFENLYKNFDDPWSQSKFSEELDAQRALIFNSCRRIRKDFNFSRVIELGCGFGIFSDFLRRDGFAAVGMDIAHSAIHRARDEHPETVFIQGDIEDFERIELFDPEIYLMMEITWYVLDHLDKFIDRLKMKASAQEKPIFLIHLLSVYAPGKQQYGKEMFTNLEEILGHFDLNYTEYAELTFNYSDADSAVGTYFTAKIE